LNAKLPFDAIIFDMDGLLVDSESVWLLAETELIESRGHIYTQEARAQIVGMRMDEFLTRLHEIYHFEETVPALRDLLTTQMLERIPVEVKAQPGAHEIVTWVHQQRIPTAIASSSSIAIIDATLKSQGWESLFDVRCTADDESRGKPAPDVYLRAAQRLGVDPTRCLALEDSANGARAAVAAGITCYAVPDPSHTAVHVFDAITPHVFDNLHAVLEHLKSL
jgi:HAD superfamily hydrolase (TIGR01509 family)